MIKLIFGLILFFLPGYFITEIYFRKASLFEKILYNFAISISVSIVIGIVLGFNEFTYKLTGGFNNLIYAYILIDAALLLFYALKRNKREQKKSKIK